MTSPSPVVSIVMATYNFERFVARAIESVLAQEYPAESLELIVVDDGSTDSTPEVVKPYLDRIRYIRKPNGGLLSTMNRGLEEARGEFLCFFSGDDEYKPEKTRVQVDFMLAHPEVGMVYSDLEVVDDNGARIDASLWNMANITPVRGRPFASLLVRNVVSGGTMMFRSVAQAALLPDPGRGRLGGLVHLPEDRRGGRDRLHPGGALPLPLPRSEHEPGSEGRQDGRPPPHRAEFRRSVLADLRPGLVTVAELMTGWAAFNNTVNQITQMTGTPVEELIPCPTSNAADRTTHCRLPRLPRRRPPRSCS